MPKIQLILSIAFFGAMGALARVYLGGFVQGFMPEESSVKFPLGTLTVNVLGCLIFGCLGYLGHHHGMIPQEWRTILLSGLLGSFTTFSTFGFETVLLYENAPHGKLYFAAANILLNVTLGVAAILLGMQIGRLFVSN
ncbi:fluoride efflux transporter CrcB [Blastopirellula marina]|uniref:Fluoride-specific ion channel FluC n=1 Tax=Blastopirellula marina TaxID=124 RepID=A0A2S8FMZ2_9BACT|nr:fluoride efflux transporter CrcB [Blastopirellula marina]PQO33565.1 fluoride efflux transporter CrcB [Blastopirellula marina]PTL43352.1 fluoride efflux transporter CrcB [Blastopirellula marina]